jgi:hypothetical protein
MIGVCVIDNITLICVPVFVHPEGAGSNIVIGRLFIDISEFRGTAIHALLSLQFTLILR